MNKSETSTYIREAFKIARQKLYAAISADNLVIARNSGVIGAGICFVCILTLVGEAKISHALSIALICFAISLPLHAVSATLAETFQWLEVELYRNIVKTNLFVYMNTIAWSALFVGVLLLFFNFSPIIGTIFLFSSTWALIYYFICHRKLAVCLYQKEQAEKQI